MHIEVNIPDDLVQFYGRARVWRDAPADRPFAEKLHRLLENWCEAMVAECPEIEIPIRQKLHKRIGLSIEDGPE